MLQKKEEVNFLKSLYEVINLNNDEADMIANGYERRKNNKEKISSGIKEMLGDDYKERIMARKAKETIMNLKEVATKDLVAELREREGVSDLYVEPYQKATIRITGEESVNTDTVEGSCVLLKVID